MGSDSGDSDERPAHQVTLTQPFYMGVHEVTQEQYERVMPSGLNATGSNPSKFTDTPITDAGLVHLKGLTNLQKLDLWNTQITDAGLVHLKGLTNLQKLDLEGTQITDAGVAKLMEELPNCDFYK